MNYIQTPEMPGSVLNRRKIFEILPIKKGSIIFAGDSITQGNEWSEIFDNPYVLNRGINSDRISWLTSRIDTVLANEPSKLFIKIGINDLADGKRYPQLIEEYTVLLEKLKTLRGCRVYIQSCLPVNNTTYHHQLDNTHVKEFNLHLEKLVKDFGFEFIDLYPLFALENNELHADFTYDAVHLNGLGYQTWANHIRHLVGSKKVNSPEVYPSVQAKRDEYASLPLQKGCILFAGDSITYRNDWSAMFNNPQVVNRGIDSDRIPWLTDRLDNLLANEPTKLFLKVGTNDIWDGKRYEQLITEYKIILDRLKTLSNCEIYIQSCLPVNNSTYNHPSNNFIIEEFNQHLQSLVHKYCFNYIDLYSPFATPEGEMDARFTCDGAHLSEEGYLLWKSCIEHLIP